MNATAEPKPLTVYGLTADELQALTRLAAADERSLSYYARAVLRDHLALETGDAQYAEPIEGTR